MASEATNWTAVEEHRDVVAALKALDKPLRAGKGVKAHDLLVVTGTVPVGHLSPNARLEEAEGGRAGVLALTLSVDKAKSGTPAAGTASSGAVEGKAAVRFEKEVHCGQYKTVEIWHDGKSTEVPVLSTAKAASLAKSQRAELIKQAKQDPAYKAIKAAADEKRKAAKAKAKQTKTA